MDDQGRGRAVAGRQLVSCEFVGVVALFASLVLGLRGDGVAAGVFMLASAAAFGLAANAVLRR